MCYRILSSCIHIDIEQSVILTKLLIHTKYIYICIYLLLLTIRSIVFHIYKRAVVKVQTHFLCMSKHWNLGWDVVSVLTCWVLIKIIRYIHISNYILIVDALAILGACASAGPLFTKRHRIIGIGIPIINLRRSSDRLRFIMGIPIPVRRRLLSE